MRHIRRGRHYGPVTFSTWAAICVVIGTLATFSVWPHWARPPVLRTEGQRERRYFCSNSALISILMSSATGPPALMPHWVLLILPTAWKPTLALRGAG